MVAVALRFGGRGLRLSAVRAAPAACALVLGLGLAAATAPPALARVPDVADTTVSVNRSVGAIRFGTTARQLRRAWGTPSQCWRRGRLSVSCAWGERRSFGPGALFAFTFRGRVFSMTVTGGFRGRGEPAFDGPLMRWRTPRGVGLGTTRRGLLRAYPRARPGQRTSGAVRDLVLRDRRAREERTTTFLLYEGRVTSISLLACPLQGPQPGVEGPVLCI
jgi:hypothetical protein